MPSSRKSTQSKPSRKRPVAGRAATLKSQITALEKKVGQKNLAKMLGVTPRSIRRYKQGTRKPKPPVMHRVKKAERYSSQYRPTKSIKRQSSRATAIIEKHPDVVYFERKEKYSEAQTEHIELLNVTSEDIEGLIGYLRDAGCDSAYFVIKGTDEKTHDERWASSEIMSLEDFSESWEAELADLLKQYNLFVEQINLIGVKHYAPSPTA